ncbi:MAG: hypothetical protein HYT98_02640 [Candidatus Sungbacteria bacterium]|nr:hypothetical protein [Candidatus Sungbacteria bacterium]
MEEAPFSPEIQPYKKPVEVGDTNKIYYDPSHPDVLIRIPIDKESKFLETNPKLIGIAEKIYRRLDEMGKSLDIDVADHQFILAKETSDAPVKPMLLAKRIEGNPLVPVDKNNLKTLEALSRIAQLGHKYLNWIESNRPKSVVTDVFRPDQYIAHPGETEETHDKLTLVDIEPRLKDRDLGIKFIDHELGMLVGPLRNSAHNDIFNLYMHHAFRTLKRNRRRIEIGSLINIIVKAPELYQRMSEDFLAGRDTIFTSQEQQEIKDRLLNAPLIVNQELLRKFGIEKI